MTHVVILVCKNDVAFVKSFEGSLQECQDHIAYLLDWNSSMARHLDENGHASCRPEDDCHCYWRKMPNIQLKTLSEFHDLVEKFHTLKTDN